ncbi:MAG: hypothetical protein ACI83D_000638 [Planctomycetota bacterium]|jgi:hypothetical protein
MQPEDVEREEDHIVISVELHAEDEGDGEEFYYVE